MVPPCVGRLWMKRLPWCDSPDGCEAFHLVVGQYFSTGVLCVKPFHHFFFAKQLSFSGAKHAEDYVLTW